MTRRLRILERWNSFRRDVVPGDAENVQASETKRAFYAGAFARLQCKKEIVAIAATPSFSQCQRARWHPGPCRFDYGGRVVELRTPPNDCIFTLREHIEGEAVPSKRFQETTLVHFTNTHDYECTECKGQFNYVNEADGGKTPPQFCPLCGRRAR